MNRICNCKLDRINEVIVTALLVDPSSFKHADVESAPRTRAIEEIVTGLVHKKECNIGDLMKQAVATYGVDGYYDMDGKKLEDGLKDGGVMSVKSFDDGFYDKRPNIFTKLTDMPEKGISEHPDTYFGITRDAFQRDKVVLTVIANATKDVTIDIPAYTLPVKMIVLPPPQDKECIPSNSMELELPVPCKDSKEDLHDWRIWDQARGETNFVCAKCFWRSRKIFKGDPGPGAYGVVFEEEIKPPLKLNLNDTIK